MNTGGSNFEKTWFQRSINEGAIARAYEAIQVLGRTLPCTVVSVSGSIVTVSFEIASTPFVLPNVAIPKAESQWIRVPTQVGDLGVAVPAGAFIGGIDGLGSGTADLAIRGNLSNLYFLPIASANFAPPPDQNKALVQGPNGVVAQTSDGNVVLTLNETGLFLTINGTQIFAITSSEAVFAGDVQADAGANFVSLVNHLHSSAGGTGDSGPPVPGT